MAHSVRRTGYKTVCRHTLLLRLLGTTLTPQTNLELHAATMQYVVKACVRGFSEIPTDAEFESGDLSLVMDDFNPGRGCSCVPGYFKRLTVNAKVHRKKCLHLLLQLAATGVNSGICCCLTFYRYRYCQSGLG